MKTKAVAALIILLFITQQVDPVFAASKTQTKKAKFGKGSWIDCKKFRGQGSVLIRIDSKGKWFCWTGKAN
jgi:hypothetical protein